MVNPLILLLLTIKKKPLLFHQGTKQMKPPCLLGIFHENKRTFFFFFSLPYALFSAKLVDYLGAWWAAGQRLNFQLIDWRLPARPGPYFSGSAPKLKLSALIISCAAGGGAGTLLAGGRCSVVFPRSNPRANLFMALPSFLSSRRATNPSLAALL